MNNVSLVLATPELINQARTEWLTYLNDFEDFPSVSYKILIDLADDLVSGKKAEPNLNIYCLVSNTEEENLPKIIALLDVTKKHPTIPTHFTFKIINILTAPHFDLRLPDTPKENLLTRRYSLSVIASQIIVNGLDLVVEANASHLKIYASNHVTLETFNLNSETLRSVLEKSEFNLDQHGNWIVFSLR